VVSISNKNSLINSSAKHQNEGKGSFFAQKKTKKIGEKNSRRAKDELEFATNWNRVFVSVYQHLKWLNAYGIINEVAIQKIVKKFKKEFFEVSDNIMDKKIEEFLKSKMFTGRVNKKDELN
jgi:hypothetical protein